MKFLSLYIQDLWIVNVKNIYTSGLFIDENRIACFEIYKLKSNDKYTCDVYKYFNKNFSNFYNDFDCLIYTLDQLSPDSRLDYFSSAKYAEQYMDCLIDKVIRAGNIRSFI